MAKLLLIEDDNTLSIVVESYLKRDGHDVERAGTFEDAYRLIEKNTYDLIVLDWTLPDGSGIELLKQFRQKGGATLCLILTGRKEVKEKEIGFDSGGDDYLTKPFHIKELGARVRALLRRPAHFHSNVLSIHNITLDINTHEVTKNGVSIKLHPQEFALLELLLKNPDRVFSSEELLDRIWKSESGASAETLRTSMRRLRKRIDEPDAPSLIENIHSVGYKLRTVPAIPAQANSQERSQETDQETDQETNIE